MTRQREFRAVLAGLVIFLVTAIIFVIRVYRNPPLEFGGGPGGFRGRADEEVTVGWELINRGWFGARVREVRLDKDPEQGLALLWVVGAIGTQRTVASGMSLDPTEDGYLLVPIGGFVVPPQRTIQEREITPTSITYRTPEYYGLIARYAFTKTGTFPLGQSLTIKYTYLGLPMTLRRDFDPIETDETTQR